MSNQAMTLDQFLQEAEHGEIVTETLRGGKKVQFTIHHPPQAVINQIMEIMGKILACVPELATTDPSEIIDLKDPGALVEMRRLDSVVLTGCVKELNDDNVSAVLSKLEPTGALLSKCRQLCGLSGVAMKDAAAGN